MAADPARRVAKVDAGAGVAVVGADAILPRPRRVAFEPIALRRFSFFHTHVVNLLKVVLPAAALALAALVLLWPQIVPDERRVRLRPVGVGIEDLENLRVLNPRFVGIDAQNQPYTLTAEQATQASGNSTLTDLAKPKADMTLTNGSWIALTADQGQYHKASQELDLWGNVNLFHDQGYEIATNRARVDFDKGAASGDEAVHGQGPNSELDGEGFRIYDKGARIFVTGKSRVVLFPGAPGQGLRAPGQTSSAQGARPK